MVGLLWQKYAEHKILLAGFEKSVEWECLYFHRALKNILSVYVDDLDMADLEKRLGSHVEDPRSRHGYRSAQKDG